MKICVLLPGKIKPTVLASAEAEYAQRLARWGVEVRIYRDARVDAKNPETTRKEEALRIEKLLKPNDFLIACDERGTPIQTPKLASFLQQASAGGGVFSGRQRLVVLIGGAVGLDESIRKRADAVWSLSSLVMAGGVARIVLLEGLYRAMTLLRGHPYHNA